VRDKFNATLPGAPYVGVLSALAIGDQSSIAQNQWQVFTRTGVNHLMSISGLHITMLASLGFALTYWLWRRSTRLTLLLPARKAAALMALLVALGYALISGYAVTGTTHRLYGRRCRHRALAESQFFTRANAQHCPARCVDSRPVGVLSPGFWLSFGAVSAHPLRHGTPHRAQPLAGGVRQSAMGDDHRPDSHVACTVSTSLTGLTHRQCLCDSLVSLVVVPLTLLGAVLPFDAPLWLAHLVMSWSMVCLTWLSALPQAVWTQHAPPAWSIVAGMLGVLWILLPRGFPSHWLGLVLMLPMFFNAPEAPVQNSLRLTIFDVGQGLAVAVQTSVTHCCTTPGRISATKMTAAIAF